jgi:hypothetical protein
MTQRQPVRASLELKDPEGRDGEMADPISRCCGLKRKRARNLAELPVCLGRVLVARASGRSGRTPSRQQRTGDELFHIEVLECPQELSSDRFNRCAVGGLVCRLNGDREWRRCGQKSDRCNNAGFTNHLRWRR